MEYGRNQIVAGPNNNLCSERHGPGQVGGFTLLEILLVVFLIGLATGLVAVNIDRDADDIAKLEARRFAALVNHLRDEATLVGLPMGVELNPTENRYRFWELQDTWQRVSGVDVLRERTVPENIRIDLTLLQGGQNSPDEQSDNQVRQQADDQRGGPNSIPPKSPANLIMVEPNGIVGQFIARFEGTSESYNVSLDNALNPVVGKTAL